MRLNLDCVRDVLLCVEENTDHHHRCTFVDFGPTETMCSIESDDSIPEYQVKLHTQYTNDELIYHVHYCLEANLIRKYLIHGSAILISDLTPFGHEFLNNIREDNVWNGVKSIASKVGAKSLEAVTQISSNVVTELIKSHFGIR